MSDVDERPAWAGQRAMAWVIDDAPVPVHLFPTLMVIARRCDDRGRGSYQSVPTIAGKTGKSQDQVKRDIRELKKLGLLLPGDEALVAHLEMWKRPSVYDIPLHVSGPKPVKESKNKTGGKGQGGGMDAPPGMDAPGGMDATGRGGMDAPGGGGMDAPQRKPLNNPSEKPSLSMRGTSTPEQPDAPDRERDESASPQGPKSERRGTAYSVLAPEGVTDEEADRFIAWANRTGHKGGGWYRTVAGNGDLPGHIEAFRTQDATAASCLDCDNTGEVGDWMNRRACDCLWWKDPAAARQAFIPQLRDFPDCSHGRPGGDVKAPNGWQHCPQCRGPGWVDLNVQERTDNQGPRSPADQRVAENQPLYEKYRRQELGSTRHRVQNSHHNVDRFDDPI